jgi:hypothetical protein
MNAIRIGVWQANFIHAVAAFGIGLAGVDAAESRPAETPH